jgi:hypothetical protein
MTRWLGPLLGAFFVVVLALGCGEPKKDPALKDKDRPQPAEKNE